MSRHVDLHGAKNYISTQRQNEFTRTMEIESENATHVDGDGRRGIYIREYIESFSA